MRALPAPTMVRPRPARLAAVQGATEPPSSAILAKGASASTAAGTKWLTSYNEWQSWARRFAKEIGIVSFQANIVADACRRSPLRVEDLAADGSWVETIDPRLSGAMADYRNPRQGSGELVYLQAWHYGIPGEYVQVIAGNPVEWWVFSTSAVEYRGETEDGQPAAIVKLTPDGKPSDGTAFVVPRQNVVRCWRPDPEWQAYATSSMASSVDDLKRYQALARYARRTAESYLAMNGILWAGSEAFETDESETDDPAEGIGTPGTSLEKQYLDLARLRLGDDEDLTATVPPLFHWDKDIGKPEWVKISEGLDEAGIAHRREALEDFARGSLVPSSILIGGGPGDANHWTEWLVDDKFYESAVAPTMDMICHSDLTQTYLRPLLAFMGIPFDGTKRVGYDPTPVLVKKDQSDMALKLWMAGLLGSEPTLKACGFDPAAIPTKQDRSTLLAILTKQAVDGSPSVTTSGLSGDGRAQTVAQPPALPAPVAASLNADSIPALRAGVEDIAAASRALANEPPAGPAAGPTITEARANRLLAQLAKIRAGLGRQLLAGAEIAYAEAMRHAGVKLRSRAASRGSTGAKARVAAAVAEGAPFGPLLGAVGLKESEMLAGAFQTYQGQAQTWIDDAQRRRRAAITKAGFDPDEFIDDDSRDRSVAAAGLLAGTLLALARTRLIEGVAPHVTGPDGSPAIPGEVTGQVPAKVVTDALRVVEGTAHVTPAASPDLAPLVQHLAERALSDRVARAALDAIAEARAERAAARGETDTPEVETQVPVYVWRHGFYGEPLTPFEPHEDLGASEFSTIDPTGDPALSNLGSFPDGDVYQPGDHAGCTCEWEIQLPEGTGAQLSFRDNPTPEEP